jgi:peptidoglycan/LPS O-acetylase OafA/YrhL
MSTTSRPRLAALTSIRFMAALPIMAFHLEAMKGMGWAPQGLRHFASLGYVAVSFFFILSGFILVYTYAGKLLDVRKFWRARLARLYPIYLLSLVIMGPFFIMGALNAGNTPDFQWFHHHLGLSIGLVLTMTQSWLPQAALAWNMPAWAVSVEISFYLIFPVLLTRLARFSTRGLFVLCGVAWLCALGIALAYFVVQPDGVVADISYTTKPWMNALKFNPLMHLPEFLAGMAGGFWFLRNGQKTRWASPLVLCGLLVTMITLVLGHRIPYPILHTGLLTPAFAAIVCGLALRPRWIALLEWRWLVLLGESSYALYLLHSFILGCWLYIGAQPVTPTPLRVLGGVFTAISVALLVYRFIEAPAGRKLRGRVS